MSDINLQELLYGEDGCSGLIGTLRMEDVFDKNLAIEAKKQIELFVDGFKNKEDFPGNDIAALCNMFIDLASNYEEHPEVQEFFEEANQLIDKWYND